MILDLNTIKQLGERNYRSNLRFRSFLKCKDSDRLDETVHRLYRFYSSKIDCTTCGNCCTFMQPGIKKKDLNLLTSATKLTSECFEKEYLETDNEGDVHFKQIPCPFLKDKKCTIYDSRPGNCRSYPHLHKKEFISRLFGVVDSYSVCPIVFNVYEELKSEFRFR